MDKSTVNQILTNNSQRNNSFYKYAKRQPTQDIQEIHHLVFPQIKTLKIINKKQSRIPFLNLDDLKHMQRPKLTSLKHRNQEITPSEKKVTTGSSQDASFLLQQCQILITKKNHLLNEISTKAVKKQNLLPPITQHGNSSPYKMCQPVFRQQNSIQPRRKVSKNKPQCKVLLGKHNDFPFFSNQRYQLKKVDRIKTKQSSNPENGELFDLDISRISQAQQLANIEFISRESLQQIKIF